MKRVLSASLALALGYCLVGWPWHVLAVFGFLFGAAGFGVLCFMAGVETQKEIEIAKRDRANASGRWLPEGTFSFVHDLRKGERGQGMSGPES